MKNHIDHIFEYYPGLLTARVLDVGSGRGSFIFQMAVRGVKITGLEVSRDYIYAVESRAARENISVEDSSRGRRKKCRLRIPRLIF